MQNSIRYNHLVLISYMDNFLYYSNFKRIQSTSLIYLYKRSNFEAQMLQYFLRLVRGIFLYPSNYIPTSVVNFLFKLIMKKQIDFFVFEQEHVGVLNPGKHIDQLTCHTMILFVSFILQVFVLYGVIISNMSSVINQLVITLFVCIANSCWTFSFNHIFDTFIRLLLMSYKL